MNAKKCDRCTKFYEPYQGDVTTKNSNMLIFAEERGDTYVEWRQFELCKDCMKDACRFMREKLN